MNCKKRMKTCSLVKQIKKGEQRVRRSARKKILTSNEIFECKYCGITAPYKIEILKHIQFMSGQKGHPKLTWIKDGKKKVLAVVQEQVAQ